jgi:hypothetical protein
MKKRALIWTAALVLFPVLLEARSFDEIFPYVSGELKTEVFSETGVIRTFKKIEELNFLPALSSGINLIDSIMEKKPGYFVESLLVVPYEARTLSRLDAYNALGKVRGLKGKLYHSHTRKADIPLFEDATRLESGKKSNPIPDPAPASSVPASESIYIRLKDVNFGNSYYRADISANPHGVLCSLTNYKSISYLFFTVMKEEKFSVNLYLEPLDEGLLIYSLAGTDVSNFIANRIDIPSAISKRLAVFIDWITDGIKAAR